MIHTEKKYFTPDTIAEALELAGQNRDNFKYVAGGTDVIVNKFQGNDDSPSLIDTSRIRELREVCIKESWLHIGALTRLDELQDNAVIRQQFSAIIEAANSVGSPLIRSSATIGGNLLCDNRCYYYNQTEWWRDAIGFCLKCDGDICIVTGTGKLCLAEFVSDIAPVLISMDALVELTGLETHMIVPLENIYTGDGINPRNLKSSEILTSLLVPIDRKFHTVFRKLRQRESLDFTSLTTAVTTSECDGRLKIVLSGVDPRPVVIQGTRESDRKDMIKTALKMSRSIDNEVHSRKYRRKMIEVFLTESFEQLL